MSLEQPAPDLSNRTDRYNPLVKVRTYLRVIIVLAFAGLFVAGALSVGKLFNFSLPCGAEHGCDTVNSHPSSRWFGVPVAYIGFIGYLLIGGLAILRTQAPIKRAASYALTGYLVTAFGAITSVALQVYSLTVIKATCFWCLTSAAIMVLLLFFHALEYQERSDLPEKEVLVPEAAIAEEETESETAETVSTRPTPVRTTGSEWPLVSTLTVILIVALAGFTLKQRGQALQPGIKIDSQVISKVELVPKGANSFGNPDAQVTIIEFADLMCPSCQSDSPLVKDFVTRHRNVKLIYRHYPIVQLHPKGQVAAAIAEVAADQGKFWDFQTAVMSTHENIEDMDRIWDIAKGVGLDVEKTKARLSNPDDPALKRLARDQNAVNMLGVTQTPTFIVLAPKMEPQAFGFGSMMQALKEGAYKSLVGG